jgi:hypothetical protein
MRIKVWTETGRNACWTRGTSMQATASMFQTTANTLMENLRKIDGFTRFHVHGYVASQHQPRY